nr:MAG TPA: hypothetical protein [Caudoviricetes sp.]
MTVSIYTVTVSNRRKQERKDEARGRRVSDMAVRL